MTNFKIHDNGLSKTDPECREHILFSNLKFTLRI